MNDEHVKSLLSEHMDGALPDAQRRRVSEHLAACAECRTELEDLRRVAKLLGSVPSRDLPPGFMARLEARRRAESPGEGWLSLALSPGTRMAAYGLTGLLVGVVFFREVRYRLSPAILGDDGGLERAAPPEEGGEVERLLAARRRAAQDRDWRGVVQGGPEADAEPAGEAPAAAPAAPAPARLSRDGAPVGGSAYTNESIQAFLEDEKKRMGIRGVAPREDSKEDPWAGVPDRPLSREEAMLAMRRMTSELTRINEQALWKKAPTVPIRGGTPRVLGTKDAARPLAVRTSGAAPPPGAGSVALAGAGIEYRAAAADSPPAAKASKPRPLPVRDGWSGLTGGMDSPGGAVIKVDEHWADLWERVRFAESLPRVDFRRDMAVAVFGGAGAGRSVRIADVADRSGLLVIRYRTTAEEEAGKATSPYHIVIVPRSDLPFSFLQIP